MICVRRPALVAGIVVLGLISGCSREDAEQNVERARQEAAARLADAERLLAEWKPVLAKAARDIKAELNKVLPSESDWEFIVEPPKTGKDKLTAFDDKLAKLDRIKVGDLTVGYEQCEECTVAGYRYERHFRARWVSSDRVYCIACCSKKAVDIAAFVEVVQRLVPVSNEVLKHVSITRGNR